MNGWMLAFFILLGVNVVSFIASFFVDNKYRKWWLQECDRSDRLELRMHSWKQCALDLVETINPGSRERLLRQEEEWRRQANAQAKRP